MKKPTKKEIHIQALQERVDHIEGAYTKLLAYVSDLASSREFNKYAIDSTDPLKILDVGLTLIKRLFSFEEMAFYLIEEKDASFYIARCEPESNMEKLRAEVNQCIDDGTFAWALRQNHPIVVPSKLSELKLVLHVLGTQARTRGMFVGTIKDENLRINDLSVSMLSITLQDLSYALESGMLYPMLRENCEIRLSSVVETASDGIISIDSEGRIILWNKGAENIFGYTASEVYGKDMSFMLPPGYLATHNQAINDLLTGTSKLKHKGNALEVSGLRKDGSEVPIEVTTAKWQTTEEVFFTVIIRDITERKMASEAIIQSHEALGKAYTDLKAAQSQILRQEKMASIGQLAAGIAHEIKNPLGIIVLGIDSLQGSLSDSLMADTSERIKKAALRANKIVNDLLSYSRQSTPALEKMDIVSIIEETLSLVEHQFNLKNIRIIRRFEEGTRMALIDSNQMKQVFINVLLNAAYAMGHGGTIEIDVGMTVPAAGKPAVRVVFSDDGSGIEPENLAKVFDPFFTTKREAGGTGLGLSVSRGIIEHQGGTITIESSVGEGTRVIVTLPAAE
ncbi:MAG: PAS domain S-box protein [Nitrospirae bacterium]|nr:PAS domain S-box protein [Nitrospirota bacterium]